MAEHSENAGSVVDSIKEKISEKIHAHDSSSSSDSDDEKPVSPSSVKAKIFRLFGREKPVHKVFGGGKRTLIHSVCVCVCVCGSLGLHFDLRSVIGSIRRCSEVFDITFFLEMYVFVLKTLLDAISAFSSKAMEVIWKWRETLRLDL